MTKKGLEKLRKGKCRKNSAEAYLVYTSSGLYKLFLTCEPYELLCWQTVSPLELVATFSSLAFLCIQNSLLHVAFSDNLRLSLQLSFICILNAHCCLFSEPFLPAQKILHSAPCQFHLHLFHQGNCAIPKIKKNKMTLITQEPNHLRPSDTQTLRSKVSRTMSP